MQEKHTNAIVSQNSFSHVFNIPFNVFYSTFIEKNFLPYVVFNKSELISMLRDTDMADEGNEITLRIINQYTFTFKVENKISRPNFKSFTHRCINSPTMFASFIVTFNFFWNSLEKNTVFEIDTKILDSLYKKSILNYVISHHNKIFKNVEDYFEENINSLEQSESISINKDINAIWNYLTNVNNLRIFFGGVDDVSKVSIQRKDLSNEYIFVDDIKNSTIHLKIDYVFNEEDYDREVDIEVLSSSVKIPKQKITIRLLKIEEKRTFIFFLHNLLQYVDNDILESYCSLKQKILWDLKKELENIELKPLSG